MCDTPPRLQRTLPYASQAYSVPYLTYPRLATFLTLRIPGLPRSLPHASQAGIGLDFELSLRAWLRGYTVGALAIKASHPAGFARPVPARQHWKARRDGLPPERNTSERRGPNGELVILDEMARFCAAHDRSSSLASPPKCCPPLRRTARSFRLHACPCASCVTRGPFSYHSWVQGESINSATSRTPRFRAMNSILVRPSVSQYVERVVASYRPHFDAISARVAALNRALASADVHVTTASDRTVDAAIDVATTTKSDAHRIRLLSGRPSAAHTTGVQLGSAQLSSHTTGARTVCPCSFSIGVHGTCSTYRLPVCDLYAAQASALAISLAPDHWPCACLRRVLALGCVIRRLLLEQALGEGRCNTTIDTRCAFEQCSGRGLCTSAAFPRARSINVPLPSCSRPPCRCACIAP